MSRIGKRLTIRNDADEPCIVYLDDQLNPIIEIPLYVLAEITQVYGFKEAQKYVVKALEEELGDLTTEEREFALRP
jgi:hypothetical protein